MEEEEEEGWFAKSELSDNDFWLKSLFSSSQQWAAAAGFKCLI